MTRDEKYLLLAIWLLAQFVIGPRLHGAPEWAIGLVFGVWFFGLLGIAITQFGPEQ
jgi:hypothetical protein